MPAPVLYPSVPLALARACADAYTEAKQGVTLPEFVESVTEKLPNLFSRTEARRVFRAVDADGNGVLDYTEVHTSLHALQSVALRRKETDMIVRRHAAFERLIMKPKLPDALLSYQQDVISLWQRHVEQMHSLRADYSTFENKLTQLYPKANKTVIDRVNRYARDLSEYVYEATGTTQCSQGPPELFYNCVTTVSSARPVPVQCPVAYQWLPPLTAWRSC